MRIRYDLSAEELLKCLGYEEIKAGIRDKKKDREENSQKYTEGSYVSV